MSDDRANADSRPAPQYGEYATPEEQRARIQQPDATFALDTGQAVEAPVEEAAPAAPSKPVVPVLAAPTRGRVTDRIITYALLGYGLFSTITAIPTMTDYSTFASNLFSVMGVDATLSDPAAGNGWALAAAIFLGLGWLATATLSWANLRAGRYSWWIPLVGGIVFNFITGILIIIPIMNDPSVLDALMATAG
ncbi:hypothetical protein FHX49_000379 [Microbacterium endophyticum]|uniref:Uncharacterized protein n=1 Tax=Microbacterium endophyticum TaxID=1526412 RepID=A0A7W4V295_9MICO|nr:DUF6264 family protein [Microbacterium endophyticum]MBB2974838.1 hypothetical protein [Microbacterium endophyticum]NIK37135.1 hypothetical protein [Microbacterium endophyticum]